MNEINNSKLEVMRLQKQQCNKMANNVSDLKQGSDKTTSTHWLLPVSVYQVAKI